MDLFSRWFDALEQRHLTTLQFLEVRRAVQSLSSLYVQRRDRIEQGSAFEGAGKRAAFATYFAPLHFLLVREIIRALNAGNEAYAEILDLGCGTGIAGAAWALEINAQSRPPQHLRVTGIDRNPWAIREAKWTYGAFDLRAAVRAEDLAHSRSLAVVPSSPRSPSMNCPKKYDNGCCPSCYPRRAMVRLCLSSSRLPDAFLRGGPNGRTNGLPPAAGKTSGDSPFRFRSAWH